MVNEHAYGVVARFVWYTGVGREYKQMQVDLYVIIGVFRYMLVCAGKLWGSIYI